MKATVQKWGDSLAVVIPKSLAEPIGLEDGTSVDLTISEGRLIISLPSEQHFLLEYFLAGITDDNLHSEQDFGQALGGEAW